MIVRANHQMTVIMKVNQNSGSQSSESDDYYERYEESNIIHNWN